MKRKINLALLIVTIGVVMVGCMGNRYDKVLDNYIKSIIEWDVATMNKLEKNGVITSFDEDVPGSSKFIKEVNNRLDYNVVSTDRNGDTAKLKVEFNYVDGAQLLRLSTLNIFSDNFGALMGGAEIGDGDLIALLYKDAIEQLNDENYSTISKTIDVKLVKDGNWEINMDEDLLDVLTADIRNLGDDGGEYVDDGETYTDVGWAYRDGYDTEEPELRYHDIGETVKFTTLDLRVNNVKESKEVGGKYGKSTASDGAKFVVIDITITNNTKQQMEFSGEFLLIDEHDREYELHDDATFNMDDYIYYKDIGAGLSKSGTLVYEVPDNSNEYILLGGVQGENYYNVVNLK